jgi:hypothetical protein
MEKKIKAYRQGDMLLIQVETIPENVEKKDLIIGYGEMTGHHHQFLDQVNVACFIDTTDTQYVSISQPAVLHHEEHESFVIPPGKYKVIRQRELDLMQQMRYVSD